jgi:hypothetical protein
MADNNSIDRVNLQIDRERFLQACILFYSSTAIVAIAVSITLLGVGEIFIGNPQGTATMLGGLHASINSLRLVQSASDRVKNSTTRSNDQ